MALGSRCATLTLAAALLCGSKLGAFVFDDDPDAEEGFAFFRCCYCCFDSLCFFSRLAAKRCCSAALLRRSAIWRVEPLFHSSGCANSLTSITFSTNGRTEPR